MAERHFTREEAERLIPELTRVLDSVRPAHREAAAVRERLQAEQQRIALAGGGLLDQAAWRADAERLARLVERVRAGLERIVALGGVPKDLELGLVDFPHQRQGQVVNLCWRYGETAIRFWHGLDEGYANRQPL